MVLKALAALMGQALHKFGAIYARRLKRKHRGYGDTFYIDEVVVKINGKQLYLWLAVDQESLPREALWVWRSGGCIFAGEAGWNCC